MRAAIYTRVSTSDQDCRNQQQALEQVAAVRGWEIVEIYSDQGVSGAKESRPSFDKLRKDATRRRFDVIMAAALDRVGRSVRNVSIFLAEMQEVGVAVYLHREAIDSSTPTGRAMLSMCSVFAELERDLIRDRVIAGIARARITGTKSGRPFGRQPLAPTTIAAVRQALAAGASLRVAAAQCGVSVGAVHAIKTANTPAIAAE